MSKGFDSDTQLTLTVIQRAQTAGLVAAGRYTKNLLPNEVALCRQRGFGLWMIAEGMGDLATMQRGQASGLADGRVAMTQANLLGAPTSVPIAAAVDFDAASANLADIDAYMAGFAMGIAPRPLLVYADGAVMTSTLPAGTRAYVAGASGWEGTAAYLAKNRAPALVQHAEVQMFGIGVDLVDINDESVVWFPETAVLSGAQPVMPDLSTLQQALGVTVDGLWGSQTAAAIARYYSSS